MRTKQADLLLKLNYADALCSRWWPNKRNKRIEEETPIDWSMRRSEIIRLKKRQGQHFQENFWVMKFDVSYWGEGDCFREDFSSFSTNQFCWRFTEANDLQLLCGCVSRGLVKFTTARHIQQSSSSRLPAALGGLDRRCPVTEAPAAGSRWPSEIIVDRHRDRSDGWRRRVEGRACSVSGYVPHFRRLLRHQDKTLRHVQHVLSGTFLQTHYLMNVIICNVSRFAVFCPILFAIWWPWLCFT